VTHIRENNIHPTTQMGEKVEKKIKRKDIFIMMFEFKNKLEKVEKKINKNDIFIMMFEMEIRMDD
jgi:hypothetical protein